MAKLIRKRIEACRDCRYSNGVYWCNHIRGWKILEDLKTIPEWCPLPEWTDTNG